MRLILASKSRARKSMLEAAGLAFDVVPADIDERRLQDELLSDDDAAGAADIAEMLARTKAETVSRLHPDALVIGADQVLALGRELIDKPPDVAAARAALMRLRGASHQLIASVALAEAGEVGWTHTRSATLQMRRFSAGFLDSYLMRAGTRALDCVGAYELEGLGVQLFERIDGDYFTILGLPLMPLLTELRARGVVAT